MNLILNGEQRDVPEDRENEPLLNLLREHFGLVGAKYGCGAGVCGACTVIVDGVAIRSCVTPAVAASGSEVRTIEGLAYAEDLHPVQSAWLDQSVPQCGYCQAGQIMSAVALLETTPKPTDEQIDSAMSGNLCRCGTYNRIRAAIKQAAETSA